MNYNYYFILFQYKTPSITSLNKLNGRTSNTRNESNVSFCNISSNISNSRVNALYKSKESTIVEKVDEASYATRKEIHDLWKAIEHQDRTINLLLTENTELKQKLKEMDDKYNSKIKDITKNISGMSSNVENLFPIIKDLNQKYKGVSPKRFTKKLRSPARKSNVANRKKRKSLVKSTKKSHVKPTNSKISEVKPDSDYVPVINCTLQGIPGAEEEVRSLHECSVGANSARKSKAAYFQNTLSSQRKIERLNFASKEFRSKCQSAKQTPVNRSKVFNRFCSSQSEIEEELPQMSKLFSCTKPAKKLEMRNLEKTGYRLTEDDEIDRDQSTNQRLSITKSVSITIPDNQGISNQLGDPTAMNCLSPSNASSVAGLGGQKMPFKIRKEWSD